MAFEKELPAERVSKISGALKDTFLEGGSQKTPNDELFNTSAKLLLHMGVDNDVLDRFIDRRFDPSQPPPEIFHVGVGNTTRISYRKRTNIVQIEVDGNEDQEPFVLEIFGNGNVQFDDSSQAVEAQQVLPYSEALKNERFQQILENIYGRLTHDNQLFGVISKINAKRIPGNKDVLFPLFTRLIPSSKERRKLTETWVDNTWESLIELGQLLGYFNIGKMEIEKANIVGTKKIMLEFTSNDLTFILSFTKGDLNKYTLKVETGLDVYYYLASRRKGKEPYYIVKRGGDPPIEPFYTVSGSWNEVKGDWYPETDEE